MTKGRPQTSMIYIQTAKHKRLCEEKDDVDINVFVLTWMYRSGQPENVYFRSLNQ